MSGLSHAAPEISKRLGYRMCAQKLTGKEAKTDSRLLKEEKKKGNKIACVCAVFYSDQWRQCWKKSN
jgi:hypothetical protein